MFSPLTNSTYRHLFAAQVMALIGTGLTTVALALLAYDLAGGHAGQVLGIALALKMVAYVGVAPVVGGFTHRLPRKLTLVTLDILRAATVLFMPFVTAVWQVYLLIFVLNACSAGFTPTFQAMIPDVLPEEGDYTQALALSRLAYELENLLSPALAAAVLTLISYRWLFDANALGFLASAALVVTTALPAAAQASREGGIIDKLTFGVRVYLRTPRLRGLLALNMAVAGTGAMVIINTVIYVRQLLDGSDREVAVVLMVSGAGAMVAALVLSRLVKRFGERTVMLFGGALMATGLLSGLLQPAFWGLLALWFALGAGSAWVQTPAGNLLRRSSQPEDRPAYFSAQFALSHACWLIAYPLAGWLGASAGLTAAFAVLAGIVAAATLLAAIAWPQHDLEVVGHTHVEAEHTHRHVHDEHHQHAHEGWEGPAPHSHPHSHAGLRHAHVFRIDRHHPHWPIQVSNGEGGL